VIYVKFFDGHDTETIAIMPTLDDAVTWMRAWLDLKVAESPDGPWHMGGDYYAWEGGLRTLLLSDTRSLTVKEFVLLNRLLSALMVHGTTLSEVRVIAADLQEELYGYGTLEA